jgi:FkbM family methyltransferase
MLLEIVTLLLLAVLTVAVALPYILAFKAKRVLDLFLRVFVYKGDEPMSKDLYEMYSATKKLGQMASDAHGIGRLLCVEVAPGVSKYLIDVSGRGQFTTLISEIRRRPPLRADQQLVIDIGANDGFQGSHSYNFIQLGWRAALVEPHPDACAEIQNMVLRKNMLGSQSNVVLRKVGVSRETDGVFDLCIEGWRHTGSHIDLDRDHEANGPRVKVQVESVKTLIAGIAEDFRLRGILNAIPSDFGVLSLDAEGMDLEILQGFLDQDFRPVYVIAEAFDTPDAFDMLLGDFGYERIGYFDSDVMYARSDAS